MCHVSKNYKQMVNALTEHSIITVLNSKCFVGVDTVTFAWLKSFLSISLMLCIQLV